MSCVCGSVMACVLECPLPCDGMCVADTSDGPRKANYEIDRVRERTRRSERARSNSATPVKSKPDWGTPNKEEVRVRRG